MDHYGLYHSLKSRVGYGERDVPLEEGVRLVNLSFRSEGESILPGEARYVCGEHGCVFDEGPGEPAVPDALAGIPHLDDSRVTENREFTYHVFAPSGGGRIREAILLLHGFNEKQWHKYLPWAHRLVTSTGRAVILFPISFHMNRAPMAWSDRHLMYRASHARHRRFPAIVASTLSNAAISIRLHARPQRFIWSGLQSYHDVVQLARSIAAGDHPVVAAGAAIDLFGYSIGCLLAQVLLMTDPGGVFSRSRLFMFCGGAVFNRMSPVSRFILDSECNVALYSYLVEHLESHLAASGRLRHYLGESHPEGFNFRSMLGAAAFRRAREAHFRRIGARLMAVVLDGDTVIPPGEVMNTVQGALRDLPAKVAVLDFDHPYSHEDPFPAVERLRAPVERSFSQVLDLARDFLTPLADRA
jgi:pimeloyl-ACP methyl ester carboxylesterase